MPIAPGKHLILQALALVLLATGCHSQKNTTLRSMQHDWQPLQGDLGHILSIQPPYCLMASATTLSAWHDGRAIGTLQSRQYMPGRPMLLGDTLRWGSMKTTLPGMKQVEELPGFWEHVCGPGGITPSGAYRVSATAWSPDGSRLGVVCQWAGTGQQPDRAFLLDAEGSLVAKLAEQVGLGAESIVLGQGYVVLGTQAPRVFDLQGQPIAQLPKETLSPIRMETAPGLLLMVRHNGISIASTQDWQLRGQWPGYWMDADWTEDGKELAAVSQQGVMHLGAWDKPVEEAQQISSPDRFMAVGLSTGHIMARFALGDGLRIAARP